MDGLVIPCQVGCWTSVYLLPIPSYYNRSETSSSYELRLSFNVLKTPSW